MITIKGHGVCGGVAFGKLKLLKKNDNVIKNSHAENTEEEIKRFEDARIKALNQLSELYEKALGEIGEDNAMIFDIHRMMLEDEDYINSIKSNITEQKYSAESAVAITADNFAEMFSSMEDSYMQARAADVRDISERIIDVLSSNDNADFIFDTPVIIAAEDLSPSVTVQLDKSKILAFVTEKGSSNSHTSILARTMNIPAVIGV